MSLAIDIDNVCAVLLADGWHEVVWKEGKSTFIIDAYEYIEERPEPAYASGFETFLVASGGSVKGLPSTGAAWTEDKQKPYDVVYCPLTSILAIGSKGK